MIEKKNKMTLIFFSIVVGVGLLVFLIWLFFFRIMVFTDDAYVEGNQVFITPLRPGFVTTIHSDDTFLAKKGELLIEMDKTDSSIALEMSVKELGVKVREVCQAFHDVFKYRAEIEMRRAELIKAVQDYQHREGVLDAEGVSLEDYEHAVAELTSNYFAYVRTETLYDRALAFVQGTTIAKHPVVAAASDKVRDSWVQLYRCSIYAPVTGLVAQRTTQVGMWVKAGEPLMSVIPLDQIWVNANFKETQLKRMRIGQKVKMRSDLYGSSVLYNGVIVGLPGGAGNIFSLLPPQNLSGNWIKIVQRLPVRIHLDPDELQKHPLRIGLSMEVRVSLDEVEDGLIPTSNANSPTYSTSIFKTEEEGNCALIEKVIAENSDPALIEFQHQPLQLHKNELDASLKNYLKEHLCDFQDFISMALHGT